MYPAKLTFIGSVFASCRDWVKAFDTSDAYLSSVGYIKPIVKQDTIVSKSKISKTVVASSRNTVFQLLTNAVHIEGSHRFNILKIKGRTIKVRPVSLIYLFCCPACFAAFVVDLYAKGCKFVPDRV